MPASLTEMQDRWSGRWGPCRTPQAVRWAFDFWAQENGIYQMQELAQIGVRETRIHTAQYLPLPVEHVFDFVTTSGNWPLWHPASQAVSGQTTLPMQLGEQVVEHFCLAGYQGVVIWTVNQHEAPYQWRIEGAIGGQVRGVITYNLTPDKNGTFFERTFVYRLQKRWESVIDYLLLRRFMASESNLALRRLREVMLAEIA